MNRRLPQAVAAGAVMAVAVSGCGIHGLQSYPLPGGATFLKHSYTVTVVFDDVTSLQPQSSVRVDDVPVGDVKKIDVCGPGTCPGPNVTGYRAKVTVALKKSVALPANAVATLEQTSLLGEKYVALGPPDGTSPEGQLAEDGTAVIAEGTTTQPDLEQIFGALSLLLNGGGVEQLQTINTELAAAMTGREGNIRDLLGQLNTLLGSLDSHRSAIVRALESLNRLSKILVAQKTTIATALTDIAPGLRILANREPDLSKLLVSLSRLGTVATRVIHKTKANTVADFQRLEPVLTRLSQAGSYLPHALEVLLDYPFPRNAGNGIFGDYTGLLADVDLQKSITTLTGLSLPTSHSARQGSAGKHNSGSGTSGSTSKGLLPSLKVPGVLQGVTGTAKSLVPPVPKPTLLDLLMGGMQ